MALVTSLGVLSNATAITTTANSTSIDLGTHIGPSENIPLVAEFEVNTAFTATGAATLTVSLNGSNDDSSYTALGSTTAAIGKATLVKGYKFRLFFMGSTRYRYYRATYTVATGPMTAGKINAFLREA